MKCNIYKDGWHTATGTFSFYVENGKLIKGLRYGDPFGPKLIYPYKWSKKLNCYNNVSGDYRALWLLEECNLEVKHEIHFVYLYRFISLCYVRYVYVYRDNSGRQQYKNVVLYNCKCGGSCCSTTFCGRDIGMTIWMNIIAFMEVIGK